MLYLYEVTKAIEKERLHDAERMRLFKQAEAVRPGRQVKVLIGLGDLLIATGMRLKGQCQTPQPDLSLT